MKRYRINDAGCRIKQYMLHIVKRGSHVIYLKNEKGIALVMVLILSAIMLALMAGLVYILTSGTQISGIQKRYKTAFEAAVGASDFTFQMITQRGDPGIPQVGWTYAINDTTACPINDKLTKATANWAVGCDRTLTIDPLTASTYDFTATIGNYISYGKIVDTIDGVVGDDIGLTKGGVTVSAGAAGKHPHFLYTIEIDAQHVTNRAERAKLSLLYEY